MNSEKEHTTYAEDTAPLVLKEYQEQGIERLIQILHDRKTAILADEPGLGKTAQAIHIAKWVMSSLDGTRIAKDYKTLIICPASLKRNWKREIELWTKKDFTVSIIPEEPVKDSQFIIINYDQLAKYEAKLLAREWNLIIFDEAHYIKSPTSARSKICAKLRGYYKLALTGTPVLNRPKELIDMTWNLNPKMFQQGGIAGPLKSPFPLYMRFCAGKKGYFGWDFSGSSNLGDLRKILEWWMVRREKKDVLQELPPKIKQIIELGVKPSILPLLQEEQKEFALQVKKIGLEKAILQASKSTSRQGVGLAKVEESIKVIKDILEEEQKVVVFAWHKEVIKQLFGALAEYGVVTATGDSTLEEREESIDAFQHNPETRIFLGNIQAAGVGITLTAASTAVFVEATYVPGEIDQAIDRCHRIGQRDSVRALFLVLQGSIDKDILEILIRKQKIIQKVLTGESRNVKKEETE